MLILHQLSTLFTGNVCIVLEKKSWHTRTAHCSDVFLAQTNSTITRLILLSIRPFPIILDKRAQYISFTEKISAFWRMYGGSFRAVQLPNWLELYNTRGWFTIPQSQHSYTHTTSRISGKWTWWDGMSCDNCADIDLKHVITYRYVFYY